MLAVGVDATAVRVLVLERPAVAGRDPDGQPLVPAQGKHLRTVLARDVGRAVGGAVVHDEDVGVGQVCGQILEDRRQVLLLVPGRDEHHRVAHGLRALQLGARGPQLASQGRRGADLPEKRTDARRACATRTSVSMPCAPYSLEKKKRVR
jgi:hypothetical protein